MIKKSSFIVLYIILLISSPMYSYTASLDENGSVEALIPPPPINDICTGAIDLGVIGCSFIATYEADPEATPDPEATGNCISPTDPGQWYTFTTPPVLPYSGLQHQPAWVNIEIFSSVAGCDDLVYVTCGSGLFVFGPEPNTTYYYLVTGGLVLYSSFNNYSECDLPWSFFLDGPNQGTTNCNTPSSIVPCENEHVEWYTITTGCSISDISIEINELDLPGYVSADEISVTVFHDDCSSIASEYDINGLGYVCSAMGNAEVLELTDIPPYTTLLFATGSGAGNMGWFELIYTETPTNDPVPNDLCNDFEVVIEGINESLTNECATILPPPSDIIIPGCASSATVWYQYDPGGIPMDIEINILSTGISSPALAAYDGCIGTLLESDCGNSIVLTCIDFPIAIQVASTLINGGTFDLEIIATPSAPDFTAIATSTDICSGAEANIDITIPSGNLVNITVSIAPGSSPFISGMLNQTINGTSSTTIDDLLINNSTTPQEAIYLITFSNTGLGCPPEPIEHSIFVFPSFNVTPLSVDECLPHLFQLGINDVITGGSSPYSSISWFWNDIDPIGTGNALFYDLTESGTITVEVVDNEGCTATATIDVSTTIATVPTFEFPTEYCQSDQDYITLSTTSAEGVEGTWNPSQIDVTQITITGYVNATFTPNANFCSETIIEFILINIGLESDFDLPTELCDEGEIYVFPVTDLNGNMGIWQIPSIDLSTISGVQSNTFVVSTPGCFLDYEYEYEVQSSITLEFDHPESICKNDPSLTLNNVSLQGYEGTWDIFVINPSSTNDDFIMTTWSPLSGQSPCLSDTTITIAIIAPFVPTFDLPEELCALDTIFTFPTEGLQSETGTWSIATIDPSNETETVTSEFTPDDDCSNVFTWEIEITEPIVPVFDIDTLYCSLDSSFVLPTESENGIQGTWSMPTIDPTALAGEELTIQFSGSMLDTCVKTTEIVINIEEALDIEFDIVNELCWTDENLLLPTTSLNGVSGMWEPSIIDIQANFGQSVDLVFTPEIGSCYRQYTNIVDVIAPYIIIANTLDPSGCDVEDGAITLDVQQGQNLEFSIDAGNTWQSIITFDALSSGGYTILIRSTDHVLCELSLDAYLNSTDGPIINEVGSTNINDCISANGTITIDAQGTNLEYSLDGMNWQTSNVFENLSEGSYEIEIREALSDCIIVATAEIIDFPLTEITMVIVDSLSDCNVFDGIIEIIAEGIALEYSIDNGANWSSSNIFTDLNAGTYEIIVQSTEGINCTSFTEVVLTAPSMPSILDIVLNNPSSCSPTTGSILVDANGNNIEYSIDGGLTWQDDSLFSNLLADNYQLIIRFKDNINCYEESLVTITSELDQLEESMLQATPSSDCDLEDGSIEISTTNIGIEYSIDTGTVWQQSTFFNNLSTGFYLIISRKVETPDCQVEQSIEITTLDCPCQELTIEAIADSISCMDNIYGSAELIKIEGMRKLGVEILWMNGTQGVINEELEEGWQVFTIKYDETCQWTDSVYIDKIEAILFDWNIQDVGCEENNDGLIEVTNVSGGNGDYSYSLNGLNFQTETLFMGLPSDTYQIYVQDGHDCITTAEIELVAHTEIEILLPNIKPILLGETITLDPNIDLSLIDSFSWSPAADILNPNELIVSISPTETTTYSLVIFYGDCEAREEITIEVLEEEEENEEDIYIGNIFSPNGDNINDILYIHGSENITLNAYKIYDRWGNMVFNQTELDINNIQAGWNGYYKGAKMVSGVYVYVIDYTKNGSPEIKIGTVTLVW